MEKILLIKAAHLTPHYNSVTFPLGIMSIASCLRNMGKYDVRILDARIDEDVLHKTIADFLPDVVGISSLTIESDSMHRIAQKAKDVNQRTIVIAGGPHPASYSNECLRDKNIDIVVIGEGEETMCDLIGAVERNQPLKDIPGIAYRNNSAFAMTKERPPIQDINALPFPAWDLVNMERYFSKTSMSTIGKRKYMNLFSSRSCPYRCIYCTHPFGYGFRTRSPENVLQEIETLVNRYGIRDFEFIDDVFNLDLKRAERILDIIIEKDLGIQISFPNGLRGDRLPLNILKKMKDAGTNFLVIAVETASPRLQRLIKKNLDLGKTQEAIENSAGLGILTNIFLMLGFPTETREEMLKTIEYASTSKAHICSFSLVTPFPGTEIAKQYRDRVERFHIAFKDYDYTTGYFNLSEVKDEELFYLQRYAFRRFYLIPRRIWSICLSHPHKRYLPIYGLNVLRKAVRKRRGNQ